MMIKPNIKVPKVSKEGKKALKNLTFVGIAGVGGYLLYNYFSGKDILPQQIFAPTDLTNIPTPRISYAETKNIANEVALTVNSSIIQAQALLIATELAKNENEQKIKDLQIQLLQIKAELTALEIEKAKMQQEIIGYDSKIDSETVILTTYQSDYNAKLNTYNANLSKIAQFQKDLKNLHEVYLQQYKTDYLLSLNPVYQSKRQELTTKLNECNAINTIALREVNNAEATVLAQQNVINTLVKEKDNLSIALSVWLEQNYNPVVEKGLAIQQSINMYAIAFETATIKIAELKKQLGVS